jgi:hypothetical protein
LDLSQQEIDKKYRALLFYKSQTQSSGFYLFSFIRKNELFSDYPPLELKPQSASEARDLFYFDATQALKEEYSLDEKQADVPEDKGFVSYAIEDGYLLVHLGEPQKFSRGFGVMLYIFGYSQKTPFAQMPKMRIITAGESCKVFNLKNRLIDSGVSVDLDKNSLVIRVPLKLLGQPDYVLTALKAYHGNLPADVGVFRKVQIK